ncbi:MAG: hypothetical protein KGZ58_11905, partial [Ignavibacteriales bacterium]|nr:hypothetical protein [Ignavibacteriales bacterium]
MLTHYYTLAHLATEFHHLCAGAVIENIFTQEKEQLILSTLDHGNILISCGRKDCYIYHRETFHRAKRNTREFFPELRGNIIKRVFIHDDDRIIIFQCSSGVEIWCAMFRGNANVLIVDSAGIVTQSFLK